MIGALALNINEKDYTKAFVLFNSTNVILGTGGPGGIYEKSVYPFSQSGSIGMAFRAGASGQNLTESQFGIASLKFRWNLSGSYQQAIPRYYSTDSNGKDEKEFLNEYFPDLKTLSKAIFLKGYQWPFDSGRVENCGSSLIDLLVNCEINDKGRKVFIDFTRNPSWTDELFDTGSLDSEVTNYLGKSSALKATPFERLKSINMSAVSLYKEHGIDLEKEPLQIAVCAQHNNGGLKGNIWWESDLLHLFPVGEVNGSHGVYRPGGAALNAGQVGSLRAAQFISKKYPEQPLEESLFLEETKSLIENNLKYASQWINKGFSAENGIFLDEIRRRMSETAGIIRDKQKIEESLSRAEALLSGLAGKIGADTVAQLCDAYVLMDHCTTHYIYLAAIREYIDRGGRSRGSYIVTHSGKKVSGSNLKLLLKPELCTYDRDAENKIMEVSLRNGDLMIILTGVREIPEQDLWFEKVWKEYIEDN